MTDPPLDLEVLALQIRTLSRLFDKLDERMVQLAKVGYALSQEQTEDLYVHVLSSTEFASHITTAVAATLSGVVRGPMSITDIQDV